MKTSPCDIHQGSSKSLTRWRTDGQSEGNCQYSVLLTFEIFLTDLKEPGSSVDHYLSCVPLQMQYDH